MLPYCRRAIAAGYGVLVLNPNENCDTASGAPIPGSESPEDHVLTVWDDLVAAAPSRALGVVAHSAGGYVTCQLLEERGAAVLPRLRAAAFTDAVLSDAAFLVAHAVNWVTSDAPMDALLVPAGSHAGLEVRSAGHTNHVWTTFTAEDGVFAWLAPLLRGAGGGGAGAAGGDGDETMS